MEEMKKKEERNEKHMSEIQAENKRLKEPLEKAKAEVTDLKKQLANYQKDKQSLQVSSFHQPYFIFAILFSLIGLDQIVDITWIVTNCFKTC